MNNTTTLDGVMYKRSRITNAFWFNNGAWTASSKTNDFVFGCAKPSIAPHSGTRAKAGMVNALTYIEARAIHKRIEKNETTAGREARANGMDIKTIHRAMEMYEDRGALGFSRYTGETA